MAETATTLLDTILHRLRDVGAVGTAHSRAFVLARLSEVQRVVNTGTRVVLDTATLTTAAQLPFYQISTDLTTTVRVIGVRESNRELTFTPWRELKQIDNDWHRRIGDRFDLWSLIGRDQLILYPTKKAASSVTVIFAKLTNALSTEGTATEMPNDELPLLVDVTIALLLAKSKNLVALAPVMEQIRTRLLQNRSNV